MENNENRQEYDAMIQERKNIKKQIIELLKGQQYGVADSILEETQKELKRISIVQ